MNSFELEAIHSNLIIKQSENEEKMYGNILVPDMGKEKPMMGTVISAGPGRHSITGEFIQTETKVGDIVYFPSFGGSRIMYEGDEYIVCKDEDVLARIRAKKSSIK